MKGLADTMAIRRRLLLTLFLPAVLVLAGGTVADYFATVRPLDEAYDDALIDTAVAIAAHTKKSANGDPELALSQDLRTILRPDARSQTFFRVGLADGTFIAGDLNGDKVADFLIFLEGSHTLVAADLLL